MATVDLVCYHNLAVAIVGKACEDYCKALRKRQKGTNVRTEKMIVDCEDFFRNAMNSYLEEPLDSEVLIKRLQEISKDTENFSVIRFLGNVTAEEESEL